MDTPVRQAQAMAVLRRLHAVIDQMTAPLAERHVGRLQCRRGCAGCCVDGLTVFAIEAQRIREDFGEVLQSADPGPAGACAFLDTSGACRIYAARPYVCRTQGLPLRWFETAPDADPVEKRDICPLNDDGTDLAQLPPKDCWTIGSVEAKLQEIQAMYDGSPGATAERQALRGLFVLPPG